MTHPLVLRDYSCLCIQGSFLEGLDGPYVVPSIEPGPAASKASVLHTLLRSLQAYNHNEDLPNLRISKINQYLTHFVFNIIHFFVFGPYPLVLRGYSWLCNQKLLLAGGPNENLGNQTIFCPASATCRLKALPVCYQSGLSSFIILIGKRKSM